MNFKQVTKEVLLANKDDLPENSVLSDGHSKENHADLNDQVDKAVEALDTIKTFANKHLNCSEENQAQIHWAISILKEGFSEIRSEKIANNSLIELLMKIIR